MNRYKQIYDSAVSKRYKLRDEYAKLQFSSDEYAKFTKFKKIKKDIIYFYFIVSVVVAIILLIICVKHNELFNNIWLTYFAILALCSILLFTALGIITQIMQKASDNKRNEEISVKDEAKIATDDLAKLSIVLLAIDNHNSYLNLAKKSSKLESEASKLCEIYKEIGNEMASGKATSEDYINFYQENLLNKEKDI